MPQLPIPPLPEPMTGVDTGSWAHDTITRRWPDIGRKILADNRFPRAVTDSLDALIREIPRAPIRAIEDPGATDIDAWREYVSRNAKPNWLEPPWFFGEHYFYRRVMAIIGHFQQGAGAGIDPFAREKRRGLEACREATRDLATRLAGRTDRGGDGGTLLRMIYMDLWGNQADLSLWPADGEHKPDHHDLESAREYLLVDDAQDAAEGLLRRSPEETRVDILVDNAGFELVGDLALADYLLSCVGINRVRLHVKPHPTYVSDATKQDVLDTIAYLEESEASEVRDVGHRMYSQLGDRRLQVAASFFWTSPLPGWEMPVGLRRDLSESSLVISKGDAHYRRLLGDLDWPFTTPFADILAYFPAPILALRTLKAELACGMVPGQAEEVARKDPAWMTDGRWGVAQLARGGEGRG